jgi:hypothetical protein
MYKSSDCEHKQTPIIVDGVVVFSVDKKLQSLIQFLTDNEINTFNSCQNDELGTCWIEYDLSDWLKVSEISFRSESQSLYNFIQDECEVLLISCDDGYYEDYDEIRHLGDNLIWSASVRFNKKFIPDFEKVVRATLEESSIISNSD